MTDQSLRADLHAVRRRTRRREQQRTVLAIEASNPSSGAGGVCIARLGTGSVDVIGSAELETGVRSSDGVMLAVESACDLAGIGTAGVDEIAVSIGPGGYTALRIAVTTAKALAFALGCPVVPVPTWAVAAESVGPDQRPALIALAGKGRGAHLTRIGPGREAEVIGVVGAEALYAGIARTLVGDGHVPGPIAERCSVLGMGRVPISLSAGACASGSAWFEPRDADGVGPDYAREPDAVTQWRARHDG